MWMLGCLLLTAQELLLSAASARCSLNTPGSLSMGTAAHLWNHLLLTKVFSAASFSLVWARDSPSAAPPPPLLSTQPRSLILHVSLSFGQKKLACHFATPAWQIPCPGFTHQASPQARSPMLHATVQTLCPLLRPPVPWLSAGQLPTNLRGRVPPGAHAPCSLLQSHTSFLVPHSHPNSQLRQKLFYGQHLPLPTFSEDKTTHSFTFPPPGHHHLMIKCSRFSSFKKIPSLKSSSAFALALHN